MMMTQTFEFKSKSNPSISYTVTRTDDGEMSCNCRGWINKRGDAPRSCTHTKQVAAMGEQTGLNPTQLMMDAPFMEMPIASLAIATLPGATTVLPASMSASAMTEQVLDGTLTAEVFATKWPESDWAMDEKLDGQRVTIGKFGQSIVKDGAGNVTLPEHLVTAIRRLPDGVYDGELFINGMVGTDVPNLALRDQLRLALFDVVESEGQSLLDIPWRSRRTILELNVGHVGGDEPVFVVPLLPVSLATVQEIWARGGEGAILKRRDSIYQPSVRSGDWVKVKRLEAHSVTVTGFLPGKRGPTTVALFRFDDGVESRTAVLTNAELAATAANPSAYIGRRLVIQCQQRHKSGQPMQPRMIAWDHMAGAAE